MHKLIAASFVAVGLAGAPAAMAELRVVDIDKASASVSLGTIASGGEILARGLSVAGKAVSNVLKFRPGESALRVNTSWVVGESDAKFRLIGVNVDLLDASGTVIASDTFQGSGRRHGAVDPADRRPRARHALPAQDHRHRGRTGQLLDGHPSPAAHLSRGQGRAADHSCLSAVAIGRALATVEYNLHPLRAEVGGPALNSVGRVSAALSLFQRCLVR